MGVMANSEVRYAQTSQQSRLQTADIIRLNAIRMNRQRMQSPRILLRGRSVSGCTPGLRRGCRNARMMATPPQPHVRATTGAHCPPDMT